MTRYILILMLLLAGQVGATTWYFSTGGNNTTGLSWTNAWTNFGSLDANLSGGDSVIIGQGVWRQELALCETDIFGTYANPTVVMCSAYVEGSTGATHIWGSDNIGTWTQIGAGNKYRATYTVPDNYSEPLFQVETDYATDTLLIRVYDSSTMGTGQWWYNGSNEVVAYVIDFGSGYDPDSYLMELGVRSAIKICSDGTQGVGPWYAHHHLQVKGLDLRYTLIATITCPGTNQEVDCPDSVFFIDNNFACVGGYDGANPAHVNLGFGDSSPLYSDWLLKRNTWRDCFALMDGTNIPSDTSDAGVPLWELGSNKGSGLSLYKVERWTFDSNTFTGYVHEACIYYKSAYVGYKSSGTIRYNTFNTTRGKAVGLYANTFGIQIYGNVFDGSDNVFDENEVFYKYYNNTQTNPDSIGRVLIYNNTFYEVDSPVKFGLYEGQTGYGVPAYNEFRFNIVSHSTGAVMTFDDNNHDGDTMWVSANNATKAIQDNCYDSFASAEIGGTTYNTSAGWIAIGYDTASTFATDPGFVNAAGGDFTITADLSMTDTTYGGQTWGVWGAIQAEASSCTSSSVTSATDSTTTTITLETDFSGYTTSIDTAWLYFVALGGGGLLDPVDSIIGATDPVTWPARTGLDPATEYAFRVDYVDAAGCYDTSSVGSVTTLALTPNATRIVGEVRRTGSVQIK